MTITSRKAIPQIAYLVAANIVIVIVMSIVTPSFATVYNSQVILQTVAINFIIGLSQLVVLSVGEYNLAVGGIAGISVAAVALALQANLPLFAVVGSGLLAGLLAGLIIGTLVSRTRISGFVLTLAAGAVLTGLDYGITRAAPTPVGDSPLSQFASGSVAGVPNLFIVAAVVALLLAVFYRWTPAGRSWLASGGNPDAAELSGVRRGGPMIAAYATSGVLASLAVLMVVSSSKSAQPETGSDWLILSFTIPIIAGTLLNGGNAPVFSSLFAALIVTVIANALTMLNVNPEWVTLLSGVLIFAAVIVTRTRRRSQRRWASPADARSASLSAPVKGART